MSNGEKSKVFGFPRGEALLPSEVQRRELKAFEKEAVSEISLVLGIAASSIDGADGLLQLLRGAKNRQRWDELINNLLTAHTLWMRRLNALRERAIQLHADSMLLQVDQAEQKINFPFNVRTASPGQVFGQLRTMALQLRR